MALFVKEKSQGKKEWEENRKKTDQKVSSNHNKVGKERQPEVNRLWYRLMEIDDTRGVNF